MMKRAEALRKCLIVFDALKRVSSKGNAGLEPLEGAEESFETDSEICQVLREWLREMESGGNEIRTRKMTSEEFEELKRAIQDGKETGTLLVPYGPLDKRPEPDVPKVTDLKEWQRLVENKPPERLDLMDDAVNVDLEGSGATWWYVCSECRREVSLLEKVCPSCKKLLRWGNISRV